MDIRKSFFMQREDEHRKRLPRQVVMAPSLSEFTNLQTTFSGT